MAAARAALLAPQQTFEVPVQPAALVVGGGVAGMTTALSLAEQGFPVFLVEKEKELGGNLRNVFTRANGKDPQATLHQLVERVGQCEGIELLLQSRVIKTAGFMGNFRSTIANPDGLLREVAHGVTILATGGKEYRGQEYGYGTDGRIVTQQELESRLFEQPEIFGNLRSVAMIQCVGPAEQYCSRICCNVALKNALALKKVAPDAQIVVFYRDIRTYGFGERLYRRAREQGVLFVRYDDTDKPEIELSQTDGVLCLKAREPMLQRPMELTPDLLVLSMPVVPQEDAASTSAIFKVPLDKDGFFLEAHIKLRPVDFNTDGVFMAGMAHYPKLLDETLVQAQAAAARAARVLSQDTLTGGGRIAYVDEKLCTGCLTCVRICPFGVPIIKTDVTGVGNIMGAAYIEAAVCQGCGICVSECPARAIQLMHYTDDQMLAKVSALVHSPVGFIPLAEIESVEV